MKTTSLRFLVGLLVFLTISAPTAEAFTLLPWEQAEVPVAEWRPEAGDVFIADTLNNFGYLVHKDEGYTSFRIVTGQKRTVHYIGRTYNAKTPNRHWTAMTKEVKGDRTTFGKRGIFYRLFTGDERVFDNRSPYGIHSHKSAAQMISEDDRYRSMGCIILSDEMLDLIDATYYANAEALTVITVSGFEAPVNYATLTEVVAKNTQI